MRRGEGREEKGWQEEKARDEKNETKSPLCSLFSTLQQKFAIHKLCFNQAILLEDHYFYLNEVYFQFHTSNCLHLIQY
jgi:hypothetical protein